MKNARQTMILSLIQQNTVETQEDLARLLQENGIRVTQATVSRDIKELRLVKILASDGVYKYAASEKPDHGLNERFVRMFMDSVLSIDYSNNIIVIKTLSGSANVAAEAIDSMLLPEVLGTMAGDNTVLVIVRNNEDTPSIVAHFKEILN